MCDDYWLSFDMKVSYLQYVHGLSHDEAVMQVRKLFKEEYGMYPEKYKKIEQENLFI